MKKFEVSKAEEREFHACQRFLGVNIGHVNAMWLLHNADYNFNYLLRNRGSRMSNV